MVLVPVATLTQYTVSKPGFFTAVEDGHLWVFRYGSESLREYRESGEPAKCVTRVGGGPMDMTIKSADDETLEAYLAATRQ